MAVTGMAVGQEDNTTATVSANHTVDHTTQRTATAGTNLTATEHQGSDRITARQHVRQTPDGETTVERNVTGDASRVDQGVEDRDGRFRAWQHVSPADTNGTPADPVNDTNDTVDDGTGDDTDGGGDGVPGDMNQTDPDNGLPGDGPLPGNGTDMNDSNESQEPVPPERLTPEDGAPLNRAPATQEPPVSPAPEQCRGVTGRIRCFFAAVAERFGTL